MTWSIKNIDKAVDDFIFINNRIPKYKELLSKNGLPSGGVFERVWGSLNKYYEYRDFKQNKIFHTKESILSVYLPIVDNHKDLHIKHIHELHKKDNKYAEIDAIRNHFGSFDNFRDCLGYNKNTKILSYTKEYIVEAIRPYTKNTGYMISNDEMKKLSKEIENFPSPSAMERKFGGLEKLAEYMRVKYKGNRYTKSKGEDDLANYISTITNKEIQRSNQKVLKGEHLDIYIPELSLAIEYNGEYWHSHNNSINPKNNEYHIRKTNNCSEQGIILAHIWEYDWKHNKDEVKEYLKNFIARKVVVLEEVNGIIIEDKMRPQILINVEFLYETEPKLQKIGNFQCWDCGTNVYKLTKRKMTDGEE